MFVAVRSPFHNPKFLRYSKFQFIPYHFFPLAGERGGNSLDLTVSEPPVRVQIFSVKLTLWDAQDSFPPKLEVESEWSIGFQ